MATEEFQMKDLQMKGLTEKLSALLKSVKKSKRKEMDLEEIGQRIREFQTAHDLAKIEVDAMGKKNPNSAEMKVTLREHKAALKEFKNEYEFKRSELLKNELIGDVKGDDEKNEETAEGLMQYGLEVQDKSKASLERTLRTIQDTKEIGQDTNAKLEANTAQIEAMYDKLQSIETTLQRSTRIIRRMARKMATDKYIWVVVFLVFAAIMFIIIWKNLPAKYKGGAHSASGSAYGPRIFDDNGVTGMEYYDRYGDHDYHQNSNNNESTQSSNKLTQENSIKQSKTILSLQNTIRSLNEKNNIQQI